MHTTRAFFAAKCPPCVHDSPASPTTPSSCSVRARAGPQSQTGRMWTTASPSPTENRSGSNPTSRRRCFSSKSNATSVYVPGARPEARAVESHRPKKIRRDVSAGELALAAQIGSAPAVLGQAAGHAPQPAAGGRQLARRSPQGGQPGLLLQVGGGARVGAEIAGQLAQPALLGEERLEGGGRDGLHAPLMWVARRALPTNA